MVPHKVRHGVRGDAGGKWKRKVNAKRVRVRVRWCFRGCCIMFNNNGGDWALLCILAWYETEMVRERGSRRCYGTRDFSDFLTNRLRGGIHKFEKKRWNMQCSAACFCSFFVSNRALVPMFMFVYRVLRVGWSNYLASIQFGGNVIEDDER